MKPITTRSAALVLAAALALVGCSDNEEIPGSTIADEMTPQGDVLVPTTEGPATIPAPPQGG